MAVGATLTLPEVACAPDHAPDAAHEVALLDDHVSVLLLPATIELGLADNDTVGATRTMTVADCEAVPPVPVHASVKVLVPVGATSAVPEVALVPDHAPEAVHSVALLDDHVNVLIPPAAIELGVPEIETTGAVAADTVIVAACEAVPPAPVQERE